MASGEEWTSVDEEAARSWLAGDAAALRLAWDAFGRLVFTYSRRSLGDDELAADCTQETFVSAWRSRQRFDPEKGTLAAWLLGIARYRVLDAYRAAPRRPAPVAPHRSGRRGGSLASASRVLQHDRVPSGVRVVGVAEREDRLDRLAIRIASGDNGGQS